MAATTDAPTSRSFLSRSRLRTTPPASVCCHGDYNVGPTSTQPIIRNSRDANERELVLMRRGLVPFFTKQISDIRGISTSNARAETVATSPTYREPFKKRRCLVPASGFYEWKRLDAKNKQPFAFDLANGACPLSRAWKDRANGHRLQSYTIITTDANELIASVHNRMPVILHPRDLDRWLDREVTQQPPIDLLRPYRAKRWKRSRSART